MLDGALLEDWPLGTANCLGAATGGELDSGEVGADTNSSLDDVSAVLGRSVSLVLGHGEALFEDPTGVRVILKLPLGFGGVGGCDFCRDLGVSFFLGSPGDDCGGEMGEGRLMVL